MKICHACGKENDDSAPTCANPNCRRYLPIYPGPFQNTIDFFNNSTNLFAIIASICTIIALSPLFLTFILGDNWFNQLLGSPIGFESIQLILIATIFGALFVYYILALIVFDFYNAIIKNSEVLCFEKFFSSVILAIGAIAIGSIILFLVLVWFTKLDLLVRIYALDLVSLAISSAVLVIIASFIHFYKKFNGYKLMILVIGLIFFISLFLLFLLPSLCSIGSVSNEMSKYYSDKIYNVTFQRVDIQTDNATPILVSLIPKIDAFSGGTFDTIYAQCHWSTNYGYFLTTNSDNSAVKKYSNEFIIPKCSACDEKVYWTYDIGDYGKSKPPVLISLEIEDPNKINITIGNLRKLGGTHANFVWVKADTLKIENNSQNETYYF